MEKLKKIASDVCFAAISIVIAGLIGVLIIVGSLLFILTKCLFCILFFHSCVSLVLLWAFLLYLSTFHRVLKLKMIKKVKKTY